MNKECSNTTFRNHMGTSNINLTILSPQLIKSVSGWAISDQESISDHSIIKYAIGPVIGQWKTDNIHNTRYITKESLAKLQEHVLQIVMALLGKKHDTGAEDLDKTLSLLITEELYIEKQIDEFSEVLKLACNKSFPPYGAAKKVTDHKTVPCWTQELTVLRKRTNAQRRLYQRTRNNDEHREKRKTQSSEGKATYAATTKKEKMRSWEEYCK
jgi:hypothetical protein